MTLATIMLIYLLGVAALCWLYVVPSLIALRRVHPNRWAILAVDVFLGGTSIGWAAALVWALNAVHRSGQTAGSHESDLTGQFDDPHERIVLCHDLTLDLSRRGRSGVSR